MDVPGIRHNAECKRNRVAFEARETPSATPVVVPNVARPRLEVRHEDMEVETEIVTAMGLDHWTRLAPFRGSVYS